MIAIVLRGCLLLDVCNASTCCRVIFNFSPGTYHMVDNFSKTLLTTLVVFRDMKDQFTKVLSFFHPPHNRELYQATLLPPALHFFFNTGPPTFDGGRAWGVVEKALGWLLPREAVIRRTWSLERFMHRARQAEPDLIDPPAVDGDQGRYTPVGVLARAADESILTPFFWSFLHMLDALNTVLTHISAWCASCPCHPVAVRNLLTEHHLPIDCPMRGRRTPELASGDLEVFTEDIQRLPC
jgi:hypothetical protein